MNPSVIREILKVTERPGIISFAGGLPSPKTFPVAAFAEACAKVLRDDGPAALQYAASEGYAPAARDGRGHAAVGGRPGAGADHHRLAAGPGPGRQGADRRRLPHAGGDAHLPGRAAGLRADGARGGERGAATTKAWTSTTSRPRPHGAPLPLRAAQLPEPDRPHHERSAPRRAVGRGRASWACRIVEDNPYGDLWFDAAAAAAADRAQPGRLHLPRLVLQGAGARPAPGLPGRARRRSTPSCCRPSRRPTCTAPASTSAWWPR